MAWASKLVFVQIFVVHLLTSLSVCVYVTTTTELATPSFPVENFGLVTYREAKILVNETSSESMKRGIAVGNFILAWILFLDWTDLSSTDIITSLPSYALAWNSVPFVMS